MVSVEAHLGDVLQELRAGETLFSRATVGGVVVEEGEERGIQFKQSDRHTHKETHTKKHTQRNTHREKTHTQKHAYTHIPTHTQMHLVPIQWICIYRRKMLHF